VFSLAGWPRMLTDVLDAVEARVTMSNRQGTNEMEYMAFGIVFGAVLGLAVGVLVMNLSVGVGLGVGGGLLLSDILQRRKSRFRS
jgi:uncharacterized membrane protein